MKSFVKILNSQSNSGNHLQLIKRWQSSYFPIIVIIVSLEIFVSIHSIKMPKWKNILWWIFPNGIRLGWEDLHVLADKEKKLETENETRFST